MTEIVSFLLALVPAAYIGWLGRALVRRIDDPAFPELRLANSRRLVFVFVACIVASLTVSVDFAIAKVGLAVLSSLAADFPARRRIFGETRGLLAYLSQTLRFWTAAFGALIMLAFGPLIIRSFDSSTVPAAVLVLVTSLLWVHFGAQLLPRIVGARALKERKLEDGFDQVLARARCRRPALHVVNARGGHWINAFALPSLHEPGVLFTAGLLEALTPEEARAIFAHEVAHLEQFDRRQLLIRELGLGALVTLFLVALIRFGPDSAVLGTLFWLWPLAVLGFVAILMARSQAREHESDLRALELTGEAEPLIAALTKLHDLLRLPRRWRAASEGRMSHPSLARRLRAIRDAAVAQGLEVERVDPVSETLLRDVDDPSQVVLLAEDRLYWLHGVGVDADLDAATILGEAQEYRSIRYSDLSDLRLVVPGQDRRHLMAVDSQGVKLKLALRLEDVQRVKAVLRQLDLQVRSTSRAASERLIRESTGQMKDRLLGALTCLTALLSPISLPLTLTGMLVLARPSRAALAAAGAIGIGAGLLGLRSYPALSLGGQSVLLVLLLEILLGLLLLARSITRYRAQLTEPRTAWRWTLSFLGGLGTLYLVGLLGRFDSPLPVMHAHLWARYEFGFILVLLGLSASMFSLPNRRARAPAVLALALATTLIAVGSFWFANRFSGDPLARRPGELTMETMSLELIREIRVDGHVVELKLSPSGNRLAARLADWSDEYWENDLGYSVLLADGSITVLRTSDLEFLEDDRVAVLDYSDTGELLLRTLRIQSAPTIESEIVLPPLNQPNLRIAADKGRWEVTGVDLYEARTTLVTGSFGSSDYVRTDWNLDRSEDSYLTALLVNAGPQALAVGSHYSISGLGSLALTLGPISGYATTSELHTVDQTGSNPLALTTLPVWCVEPLALQAEFVCAANDRESHTVIWSIDTTGERITPIGSLPGHYYQASAVFGGQLLLGGYGVPPTLVDVSAKSAWALDLGSDSSPVSEATADTLRSGLKENLLDALFGVPNEGPTYQLLALQGNILAAAVSEGDASRVTVYRLRDADR